MFHTTFNIENANAEALEYTAQLTSRLNEGLSRCEELNAKLNEKGFMFQSIQVGAKTFGRWTGKVTGSAVGAAPGVLLGNPPASIGGVLVGQKFGADYGEFLADYTTERAYHYIHSLPLEHKLQAEITSLQASYEQQFSIIEGELQSSGKSPAQQAYIMRQIRQHFQYQPHASLLNSKQLQDLKSQVDAYDQSIQQDQTNKLTKIISLQDKISAENQKFRRDLIGLVTQQLDASDEIIEVSKENQAFLKSWGATSLALSRATDVKVNAIIKRLGEHTVILKRLNADLDNRYQREVEQAKRAAILGNFQGANDAFSAFAEIGGQINSKTLVQIGTLGNAGTKIAYNCALLTGGIPGLVAPTGLALLTPVTAIAVAAFSLFNSLFGKRKKSDGLSEALQTLSRQVVNLHNEMRTSFQYLDQRLEVISQIMASGFSNLASLIEFRFSNFSESANKRLDCLQSDLDRFVQQHQLAAEALFLQKFYEICRELADPAIVDLGTKKIQKRLFDLKGWIVSYCQSKILNGYNLLYGHRIANSASWIDKILQIHADENFENLLGYLAGLVVEGNLTNTNEFDFNPEKMPNIAVWRHGVSQYLSAILSYNSLLTESPKTALLEIAESAENGVKFITHLQKNRSCLVASLQKQLGVALQNYYQAVMISMIELLQNSESSQNNVGINTAVDFSSLILPGNFNAATKERIISDANSKGFIIPNLLLQALKLGVGKIEVSCTAVAQAVSGAPVIVGALIPSSTMLLCNTYSYVFKLRFVHQDIDIALGNLTYETNATDILSHYIRLSNSRLPLDIQQQEPNKLLETAWPCSKLTSSQSEKIGNVYASATSLIPLVAENSPKDSSFFNKLKERLLREKSERLGLYIQTIHVIIKLLRSFLVLMGTNEEQLNAVSQLELKLQESTLLDEIQNSQPIRPALVFPLALQQEALLEAKPLESPMLSTLIQYKEMISTLGHMFLAVNQVQSLIQEEDATSKVRDAKVSQKIQKADRKYSKGKSFWNSDQDKSQAFFSKAVSKYTKILESNRLDKHEVEKIEKRLSKIARGKYRLSQ